MLCVISGNFKDGTEPIPHTALVGKKLHFEHAQRRRRTRESNNYIANLVVWIVFFGLVPKGVPNKHTDNMCDV